MTSPHAPNEVHAGSRAASPARSERDRLLRAFDQAPGFIILMAGPEHVVEYVNDAHRKLFRSSNWIGKTIREAFPELEGQGFFERLDHVYRSGERFRADGAPARFSLTPDEPQEERFLDFVYEPLRDEDGRVTGILCEGADVTERHLAEAHAAEVQRRLDAVLNNASVAVFLMDERQHCTFANRAAEELTGYTFAEMQGRPLHDVIHHTHPDGRHFPIEDCAIDRAFPENANTRGEEVFVRKDGSFYPVAFVASPIRDDASRTIGTIIEVRDISTEKAAQRAIEAAQAEAEAEAVQRSAILGQLAEGVIVTDRAGRISFVNDAARRIHGVAELGVEPDRYTEVYHLRTEQGEPYPPDELPLARAVLRGETVNDARWWIGRPDGSEVLAIGSARPVLDPAGDRAGAVLTLRDETARVAAERSLRESEARVRALTDNLPSGMVYQISTGPDGSERRFLYVSQSHETLTGVAAEAVLADPTIPYNLIVPEHRPLLVDAEAVAIRDRTPFDVQVQFRRTDGEVRWCRIISAPREQPDGSLVWDGLQIDITKEKVTADALRAESEALETLNRTGTAVAAELDLARVVQQVTEAGVELTGATFGAFFYNVLNEAGESYMLYALSGADRAHFDQFGMPRATDIFHPTFVGEAAVRSDDILADPRYGRNAPHHGMPKGHLPVRSYLAVSVTSRSGEVLGGLFFGHPEPSRFGERHERLVGGLAAQAAIAIDNARLFQAVQRANETLEARVAERTEELVQTQEALQQSQKMEAVGQLTGGLAHDFNNLLAGISGSLELMSARLSQGRVNDVERYIGAAQGAARRAAALTHRLLAFSRRQTLDPKPTSVNRLVAGMEELIRRTVGPAISVETIGATGLWPTLVDPPQLENALLNLCINARDAMPEGGRITIETANKWLDRTGARQHDMPEGQYISLCVTDTGTGMTPHVKARAFDPFFTTKPLGEGTGLGLSMIYGFAKQSGGQVRIYSELGQGTTVCIYLPRHHGTAEVDDEDVEARTQGRSAQGETVLVVDDEPTVRMLVTDVLEELGYNALEAADSAAGLKVLQSDARIDLLVSDVGLPGGMNGRQMADAARAHRPDLKVLFITGYADNAAVGNGQLAPGMAVLTKPFPVDTLAARIAEMIKGNGPER